MMSDRQKILLSEAQKELLKTILLRRFVQEPPPPTEPGPNFYSELLWNDILDEFNAKATAAGVHKLADVNELINRGHQLHTRYCFERAKSNEHAILLHQIPPPRDDKLRELFEPCLACQNKVLICPNSVVNPYSKERETVDQNRTNVAELDIMKDILAKYSKGLLLNNRDSFWSKSLWERFAAKYNGDDRAKKIAASSKRDWIDMIIAGKRLQFLFASERKKKATATATTTGIIPDVDKDLKQIFGFCESCVRRIPIFPLNLDGSSTSLSGRRRASSHTDEGSRSVRRRSESVGVEGNEHESMLRAVAVLDEMHSAELIDVDTLYRIIGVIIAEPGFVKLLVSTTSTSAQRFEFVHLILQDSSESAIRETISVKSSAIHSSKASDLIISMHDQNMITGADVVLLARRIEVDRVLVSYLLCNVAKERKAEMLPKFLEVIKSRES